MKLLERYIFKSASLAFLATLLGLTGVIWITQALREFDLLTSKGQSIFIFLAVTGLTIPSLLMLIAPIALFIAVLYTLNKLNGDSELIVMSAAGGRPWTLLRPFLVLTLAVLTLDATMSVGATPWSFRTLRDLVTHVRADFITRVVRPGQFTTLDQGFVFHYRERGPNGELLGVFMQDRRDANKVMSYIAEGGQTAQKNDQNYLILNRGNIQSQAKDAHDTSFIVFEDYTLDLSEFSKANGETPLKPRERTTHDLLRLNKKDPYVAQYLGRFRAELADRFVGPLYTIVATVFAFAAVGQARTTRQGRGQAIGLAILSFALVRVGGIGLSTLIPRASGAVWLAYALPVLTVGIGFLMIFGVPSFKPVQTRDPANRPVALGLS